MILIFLEEEMRLNTDPIRFMILVMQNKGALGAFGQVGQLGVHPTEHCGALEHLVMHVDVSAEGYADTVMGTCIIIQLHRQLTPLYQEEIILMLHEFIYKWNF
jgi:hypothetical protein